MASGGLGEQQMAQHFAARIYRLKIEEHPDADRLEIAHVLGYRSVVPRGQFQTGDLAAYIPEQAIVPLPLLQEMGLEGRLAGAQKNRVRAQRLRGVLSQGLVYGGKLLKGRQWSEGDDCTLLLGIHKYEPPIPPEMSGSLERYSGTEKLAAYDVENVKDHLGRIREGEQCTMHEKIHGTLCYCVVDTATGKITTSSKGRAASQLVFSSGVDNVYGRMCGQYADDLLQLAQTIRDYSNSNTPPVHTADNSGGGGGDGDGLQTVHVFCEVYGRKVQDLTYGCDLDMAVFDVLLPPPPLAADVGHGSTTPSSWWWYAPQSAIRQALTATRLRPAPLAYEGPFSTEVLDVHTSGKSLVAGASNLREGVVVRPDPEREDADGRVMLKSVSPDYLCRKGGGTEYN